MNGLEMQPPQMLVTTLLMQGEGQIQGQPTRGQHVLPLVAAQLALGGL
jgi:hypothetical protein